MSVGAIGPQVKGGETQTEVVLLASDVKRERRCGETVRGG